MISFYPGPSKLYEHVGKHMQDAIKEGVLSINHRSAEFVAISEKVIQLLRQKLSIPKDYQIFYTSSATECWEIIAQSLIEKESTHIYNGAFGEKWFEYTQKIKPNAKSIHFDPNQTFGFQAYKADKNTEIICLVQNETSNGTQIKNKELKKLRENNSNTLIAVDATSSLAGIKLDIKNADIWFAGVQKCFGLPAGLGLLICSPKAIERALKLNENNHYNSLPFLIEKMKVYQTTYTPNVLSIFLLMKSFENISTIKEIDKQITSRAYDWYSFFSKFKTIELLITNKNQRSDTVIAVKGEEQLIAQIKKEAKKEGLLLGNGYGAWAKNTFRIANFPAIKESEIKKLKKFLGKQLK